MSLAILFASAVSLLLMIYNLYQARKNRKLRSKAFRLRLGALTEGQRKKIFPWHLLETYCPLALDSNHADNDSPSGQLLPADIFATSDFSFLPGNDAWQQAYARQA
jgi:hypothetical protein